MPGMGMSLRLDIRQTQELTLEQRLKHEIRQELALSQKIELKIYLKIQDYFKLLYEDAEKRAFGRDGIDFEYAVIRKNQLPSNFPVDAGFCMVYYNKLTGEATDTLRFVVTNAVKPFPARYQEIVAVHEYGESLLIGHQEASVLEWGMAKRCGFLGKYLGWMERVAPAKLADLSKYSVLWDMMPDEVVEAAKRLADRDPGRQKVLEIMKELQMPEEVKMSCSRFDIVKSQARDIISISAAKAQMILDAATPYQERALAARYALQSVATRLAQKGQPWLAHAMDAVWREAANMVGRDFSAKTVNTIAVFGERLAKCEDDAERRRLDQMIHDYSEPLMGVMPLSLQQAMEVERAIAAVEAKITREMGAKEILGIYMKAAGAESMKKTKGADGEEKNDLPRRSSAKRFLASYILLRGFAKISELQLDYASSGEITQQLCAWWEKSVRALDRRYAKQNGGTPLFQPTDPLLSKGLREMMSFYDDFCSSSPLRKEEAKMVILPGFAPNMFSGCKVKSQARLASR